MRVGVEIVRIAVSASQRLSGTVNLLYDPRQTWSDDDRRLLQ